MKALLQRQIYRPTVVLMLLVLTRLMVSTDFSVVQVALVLLLRSAHMVVRMAQTRLGMDKAPECAKSVCCHC